MDLQYPIGPFKFPAEVSAADRRRFIDEIEQTPANLCAAVAGLSAQQIDTPYRPGGWTVRQVVHHLPDSHLNSYLRFRWALTENEPTIKPYDQVRSAELFDSTSAPVEVSLMLLEALHRRWVILLRSLSDEDLARKFHHPEIGVVRLDQNLALYAWHGRHHTAHISSLRDRMGWK